MGPIAARATTTPACSSASRNAGTTPATAPRQPACTMPTASGPSKITGAQSAVATVTGSPGTVVKSASASPAGPGLETRTQPVKMHFRYSTTFGSNTPEAYERLILDAMIGDGTLFIRGDETEASWKLVTPLLEHWKECGDHGLATYASGSWGPLESERLLWDNGHEWRRSG